MGAAQMRDRGALCPRIVTNGGVASTVRDAHVREFACTVVEDGCAAFSDELHRAAIEGLRPVARIATIAQAMGIIG
jgi:nicotinamidase-related amidase